MSAKNNIYPTQTDLTEPGDPYFFFHIPKTAGSTLADILEDFFSYQEICPAYYTYELSNFTTAELNNFRLFRGHMNYHVLCQYLNRKPRTITFLRHPVDHAISIFSHLKRKTDEEYIEQEIGAVRQMNLEKFIFQPDRIINLDYSNLQLRTILENSELDLLTTRAPSLTGLEPAALPSNQALLEYAKGLLADFFFVGVAERFEDSLLLLSYIFGVRPLEYIPRINVSHNRPAKDAIAPEVYRQIAWKSSLDFELYTFAQELFEARFKSMLQDLLERYGTTEQKKLYTDETVPQELVYQWLEEHYRYRFTRRHPAVSFLTHNAEQPLNGRQWYKREHLSTLGIARWTGPGSISTLDLPLAAESDLRISFEVALALQDKNLDTVKLFIDDHPLDLTIRPTLTASLVYEAILPQECLEKGQGLARLFFHINEPVRANELNPASEDDRSLGVVIKWIKVEPFIHPLFVKSKTVEKPKLTLFSKAIKLTPPGIRKAARFLFKPE